MLTRLKRESRDWDKIFVTYSAHKRLITRIYRELKKLNGQRVNDTMKNWASELNRSL
jgi:uridine kinase